MSHAGEEAGLAPGCAAPAGKARFPAAPGAEYFRGSRRTWRDARGVASGVALTAPGAAFPPAGELGRWPGAELGRQSPGRGATRLEGHGGPARGGRGLRLPPA